MTVNIQSCHNQHCDITGIIKNINYKINISINKIS